MVQVLSLVTTEWSPIYSQQADALAAQGVDITTIQVPGRDNWDDSRSIFDYVRFYVKVLKESTKSYDLIHANNGLTAPIALAQPHRPIVLTLWGSDLEGKSGSIIQKTAGFYDEIIVRNLYMSEVLGNEAHVIPQGVDLDLFSPMSKKEAQAELGWGPGKHVLFPYSPDRAVKNYPLAKEIVDEVDSELEDNVTLQTVFNVDHEAIPTYINASDALLLTSHREGSPNSVKEAMACNVPVVSTDVGDVRKQLKGVESSAVSSDKSSLVSALSAILEKGKRSDGREKAQNVSLESMANDICNIYELALSNS